MVRTATVAALAAGLFASTNALNVAKRDNPKVVGMSLHRRDTSKIVVSSALRRRATVGQTLDNFEDGSLYFANATIGTPPQNFRFHLDTGSSDLWANTANSQICKSPQANSQSQGIPCTVSGTYNANKSSSYKYVNSEFQIKYADGTGASGDYVTDNLNIGGVTINSQQFGVGYASTSSEGVLGIGYPLLEASVQNSGNSLTGSEKPYSNVPQSMVDQGLINSQAYSLWLDDVNSATGSILFGGVDTAKYQGSLVTMPIQAEGNQQLEMIVMLDGVSVVDSSGNNKTAQSKSVPVLLDSGSTLSYLPSSAANIIYSAVGAEFDQSQQLAFCSCNLANSSSSMSFSFAGGQKVISVDMEDMVLPGGISRSQDCTFGIVPQDSSSGSSGGSSAVSYTLGDSFIRNAYVVYDIDNNMISLAQTDKEATNSNVMEIQKGSSGVPDATGSASTASSTGGSKKSAAVVVSAPTFFAGLVASVALIFATL